MERKVGTISRGVRCPIIREGDDLAGIVVNSVAVSYTHLDVYKRQACDSETAD